MLATEYADCPYCGERIELVVDESEPDLEYIEDCEVCCRPIIVTLQADADGGVSVNVRGESE
ncbi:MAG: CPXCG motif-containing cysteine-rich protein [Gammaproteobacteria bacterium]|nr:CPXCG motif-containing cysteine-rich protein [Gammaproteobacteria bacterium]